MAIFFRKTITHLDKGSHWIYKNPAYIGDDPSHSRCLQWAIFELNGQKLGIFNVHGLWNGKGKGDTPERIEQSKAILNFAQTFDFPVLLCGDFNLMCDTKSILLLEAGYQNLIRDYHIQSTRSCFYKKPERYADYIFTPKNLKIRSFKVNNNNISDHLPLLAVIELGAHNNVE